MKQNVKVVYQGKVIKMQFDYCPQGRHPDCPLKLVRGKPFKEVIKHD
jgi:hypothetical protein